MLDVHPPHESAHSWKDFFIHIATIVVGLLIAVGLEQTVEYFHHRSELREARAQLAEERDINARVLDEDADFVKQMRADLAADMAALREREANPSTPLAGRLRYDWNTYATVSGAWDAVDRSGVLSLMPERETRAYSYRYKVMEAFLQVSIGFNTQMEIAAAIAKRDPDGNLTPADVRDLIVATSEAQGRLELESKFLYFARHFGLQDAVDEKEEKAVHGEQAR